MEYSFNEKSCLLSYRSNTLSIDTNMYYGNIMNRG